MKRGTAGENDTKTGGARKQKKDKAEGGQVVVQRE